MGSERVRWRLYHLKTMVNLDKIIRDCIKEINKQLPKNNKASEEKNFQILGPESTFDSMALVNFVLLVEEKLKKENKVNLNLLNFLMDQMWETSGHEQNKGYTISDFTNDIKKKL